MNEVPLALEICKAVGNKAGHSPAQGSGHSQEAKVFLESGL